MEFAFKASHLYPLKKGTFLKNNRGILTMSMIISENQRLEQEKIRLDTELKEATVLNDLLSEAIVKIQQLSEQIPCLNLEADYTTHSLLKNYERLIHKIHATYKLQIKLLNEFLNKTSDAKYYQACILNYEKIINSQKQKIQVLTAPLENVQNISSTILDEEKKNSILAVVTNSLKTTQNDIEYIRLMTKSIQSYAEAVNYQNSLSAKIVQVTSAFALKVTSSFNWLAQNTSSLLGMPSDLYGPPVSLDSNKFVTCYFRALSTGFKAAILMPSQTKGVIKIRFQEEDEFWIDFALNNDPVIAPEMIKALDQTIEDRLMNKEISKVTANDIYQELHELNVKGGQTRLIGSQHFPKIEIAGIVDLN